MSYFLIEGLKTIFILSFILIGISQNVFAEQSFNSFDCCGCHNDIFKEAISKNYVHLPFLQKKCSICHVKTDNTEGLPPRLVEISGQVPHLPMRDINELSISVCTECHPGFTNTGNHPLKGHNFLKVTIPADYSTGLDGRLTCLTCHGSHASDFRFRTIKSRGKELCVGCHKGYPNPIGPPPFSLVKKNSVRPQRENQVNSGYTSIKISF